MILDFAMLLGHVSIPIHLGTWNIFVDIRYLNHISMVEVECQREKSTIFVTCHSVNAIELDPDFFFFFLDTISLNVYNFLIPHTSGYYQ